MVAIPNHVLVTGGTGFIATHILHQLIKAGYKVTATTRDAAKASKLYEEFPVYTNTVTFVSVPDFSIPGAFDNVFRDRQFDYILHTASPIPFLTSDLQKDIIDPGPLGTRNLMQAAHNFGGTRLKRIVVTSSGVTLIDPFIARDAGLDRRYIEDDWNTITAAKAVELNNPGLAYFASKTLGERAAWDFVAKEKPAFDLSVVLPVIVLGPSLRTVDSAKKIEQGGFRHIYEFINGTNTTTEIDFNFYSHVDVRDVARAHILAMLLPAAGGQRISLSSSDVLSPQTVVNIINKNFPQLKERVATGDPAQIYPKGAKPTLFSGAKAHEVFGDAWQFRSLETTVTDFVAQVLEHEKAFAPLSPSSIKVSSWAQ